MDTIKPILFYDFGIKCPPMAHSFEHVSSKRKKIIHTFLFVMNCVFSCFVFYELIHVHVFALRVELRPDCADIAEHKA